VQFQVNHLFTNGKTVAFVGASTDGNFSVLVDHLSTFLPLVKLAKTAKNILSNPTEVSTT
jgi:hypothetical protein